MFTGIITHIGTISQITDTGQDKILTITCPDLIAEGIKQGDSIATNGICLTVTEHTKDTFTAQASQETINCTTLGTWQTNEKINLEPALRAADRMGGHIVTGHIDGIATIQKCQPKGDSINYKIQAPLKWRNYIAAKGSICLDGISLTVNTIKGNTFEINIIPHTLNNTIINTWQNDTKINLEIDILARYMARLLQGQPRETQTC